VYMRVQEKGKETIVALCDKELVGKVLREGEMVLDLEKYASFYKGEATEAADAARELKAATSINLVGKRSVALARKLGLVEKGEIMKIGGVPHVQIYLI